MKSSLKFGLLYLLALVVLIAFIMFVASCERDEVIKPTNKLVGTWANESSTYTFTTNKVEFTSDLMEVSGKYIINNTTITMQIGYVILKYNYTISKDTLYMYHNNAIYKYVKNE